MYLGMDVGSISVKTALVSAEGALISHHYYRHYGRPHEVACRVLEETLAEHPEVGNLGFTGSSGARLAELFGAPFDNEITAHARAAAHLTPEVRTLIEVGGEDSRLILLDEGDGVRIRDFAMNSLCAAGCGSFLDQQASRLGLKIEEEFGAQALASEKPARVAGRCSVFAKTDMIHLQQQATPLSDIVAGLCFAFARNFVSVVAHGKEIIPPVAFHGGVAYNQGMVRAFRELLELKPEQFLVPEHAATAGAVGAALQARQQGVRATAISLDALKAYLAAPQDKGDAHPPLPDPGPPPGSHLADVPEGERVDAYLGVDIGSISTNVVLIDADKRVLAKSYLMTAGRPIEAVRQGLTEVGATWADRVNVRGVCTTGSGRYLIGDFLGADVVKNEITAQARAAAEIDPQVDTIFEIGGQDSKYISLEGGAIIDFEMNKACAAGTGSFLEEQAERLGISIKGEFAKLALEAKTPVRLGERCTVFMETDLVGFQARGASTGDLAAGLAYSIVHNYLNRVVGERKIGNHIFFQGGTAFNRAVVAAFRQVTGKPVTVPEHHEVTGAIGCALMAREAAQEGVPSRFKGWDLSRREYQQDSFECKACANRCQINRVRIAGEEPLFYGGRCEKYEKRRSSKAEVRDLFAEREQLLLAQYREAQPVPGKPLIGIPRALHFAEYLPFWLAFFNALDLPVRLSSPTSKRIINLGTEATMAEFCFPVKVAHGHAQELIESGITHLFLPSVAQLPRLHEGYKESVSCPYVQSLPFTLRAALEPEAHDVQMLTPIVNIGTTAARSIAELYKSLRSFGVTRQAITAAWSSAHAAQRDFSAHCTRLGAEALAALKPDEHAVVIVSRPYNGCDNGINLELPKRFRELGTLPIPLDMLPVEQVDLSREFPDLTWRYGQKILAAADIIRRDPRLAATYITNFGCGPDSFLTQFFRHRMGGKVYLTIEIDEHASDVGALTRCEAFLDSLHKIKENQGEERKFRTVNFDLGKQRKLYIPNMCDEGYALAAAFRAVGVSAEVMPPSDADSVALAKKCISGKECFPCLVTTGDMLRQLAQPGVKPEETAFLMPSAGGGCRIGYYNILQRQVLDQQGYQNVPLFVPNQSHSYYAQLSQGGGNRFVHLAWRGIIAVELLGKARRWVGPREQAHGATAQVYQRYLDAVCKTIEAGQALAPVMREARAAFEAIPAYTDARPWVGIIGEVFVRMHDYSNQYLIERLEELGVHVWMAPFSEWIFYVNGREKEDAWQERRWSDLLLTTLVDRVMKHDEHVLAAPWRGFLPNLHENPPDHTIDYGSRYIDPSFRGEAILSLGKAADFYHLGLAGVINVMPFTCMPGTITGSFTRRFQRDYHGMPFLNLAFDGQAAGNLPIRLEAFVQQCKSYLERKGDQTPAFAT